MLKLPASVGGSARQRAQTAVGAGWHAHRQGLRQQAQPGAGRSDAHLAADRQRGNAEVHPKRCAAVVVDAPGGLAQRGVGKAQPAFAPGRCSGLAARNFATWRALLTAMALCTSCTRRSVRVAVALTAGRAGPSAGVGWAGPGRWAAAAVTTACVIGVLTKYIVQSCSLVERGWRRGWRLRLSAAGDGVGFGSAYGVRSDWPKARRRSTAPACAVSAHLVACERGIAGQAAVSGVADGPVRTSRSTAWSCARGQRSPLMGAGRLKWRAPSGGTRAGPWWHPNANEYCLQ